MSQYHYLHELEHFLRINFISTGHELTQPLVVDPFPQNSKYEAMACSINGNKIIYRKGYITPDRPGCFLSIWKKQEGSTSSRSNNTPLEKGEVDYLFVKVNDGESAKEGIYIFPQKVLLQKGMLSSETTKGKMAFRVFPPWTTSRGEVKSQVFSDSAKKTQSWQSDYFLEVLDNQIQDQAKLSRLFI